MNILPETFLDKKTYYVVNVATNMYCKVGVKMIDKSQFNRGTLEGRIIKIISREETYGYEIVTSLQKYGFTDVKEGTIYPLLIRLEKKKLIFSKFKESPLGAKRKHYFLRDLGEEYLIEFMEVWNELKESVDKVFGGSEINVK